MSLFAFLSGAVTMGLAIAGLFFLRFWRVTRDGLFLSFALAFWLLGIAQTAIALADIPDENRGWLYILRLLAFVVIIVAIVRKNRPSRMR